MSTAEFAKKMWEYGSLRCLLERQAERYAAKVFLLMGGKKFTYADMDRMANQAANGLRKLGVGSGDKVAVMMKNCPEWFAVWFGLAKLGAVTCPVNSAYKGDGLAYQLKHSDSVLLIVDDEFVDRVAAIQPELTGLRAVLIREAGVAFERPAGFPRVLGLDALFAESADPPPAVELSPQSPASILYTSGTTGPPKGCVLPHGYYLVAAHQMVENCGYVESDICYTSLPLFHINCQCYSALCMLAAGATLALEEKFTASGFWQRMVETGATVFNIIGGVPLMLWNQPVSPLEKQHKARLAFGVPVPKELWPQWEERFGVKIVYAYGMTENALPTLFPFADTPARPHLRGSGGKASASADVFIVDDMDRPLPPGQIGEVVTRPRIPWSMMLGYYKNPEATFESTRNLWFHTGDLGYLDDEGYFFFADRKKDAIRRRGEMISSWSVESVVAKFPGVEECAAVAVPSEMTEDEIMIAVVPKEGGTIDPAALIRFCEERMARFQVPRYVRIVPELPKTQTQRVEKYRLRKEGVPPDAWDREANKVR